MTDPTAPIAQNTPNLRQDGSPGPRSRSREIRELLAGLSGLNHVRGGLIVTPDGLVITADLPPRSPMEPLAALGATLGRELELGAERLGRGEFKTALFSADDGTIFVGGSRLGFVVLLADLNVDVCSVRSALGQALDRLHRFAV
jgi:predicted regulator of Ras-like GTPase activity (Roadblock/LC7/MglB family)